MRPRFCAKALTHSAVAARVDEEAKKLLPNNITYCGSVYETFEQADAVVLLTEWNAYRGLDLDDVLARMKGRVFCDLRNVYEPEQMTAIDYVCVGRSAKSLSPASEAL